MGRNSFDVSERAEPEEKGVIGRAQRYANGVIAGIARNRRPEILVREFKRWREQERLYTCVTQAHVTARRFDLVGLLGDVVIVIHEVAKAVGPGVDVHALLIAGSLLYRAKKIGRIAPMKVGDRVDQPY